MRSASNYKKQGKAHNDLVISDDIFSSESYAGNGQNNVITKEDSSVNFFSALESPVNNKQRNASDQSPVYEGTFDSDFKLSPEREFHIPRRNISRNQSSKFSDKIQKSHPNAIKSARVKSLNNVVSLPELNVKKSASDRDQRGNKSNSINDQIEKLGHQKQKMTVSEKKSRLKEVMAKGRQNWSVFKAEIDFVKSVEASHIIPPYETGDVIKNENAVNSNLYDLSKAVKDLPVANIVTTSSPLGDSRSDHIKDEIKDFKAVIRPTLKSYESNPIDEDLALSLKQILFSSTGRSWGAEWYRQNLDFHPIDSKLPYVMIQRAEGPNSVMCAVQAEFMTDVLYRSDHKGNWLSNVKRMRNHLLSEALARIICRCRPPSSECFQICLLDVSMKGRSLGTVKSDGITECLRVHRISCKEDLRQFIFHHVSQFVDKSCPGLILLVVSCLLTHGISNCLEDLGNDGQRLVSPLGIPREELMSLLLTGNITSHYFNNNIQIVDDSGRYVTIRGVPSRSSVGFLSTEDHCEHCKQIGTYLKTPKYPLWVAKLGPNKYALLYCENGNLVNDWKAEVKFQLNLYCPIASKYGVKRMTIDSSVSQSEKCRAQEEEREREKEKENHNKEVTEKRLKNMSDYALKFVLDDESVEEYLSGHTTSQPLDDLSDLEKVIRIKWPNADILLNDGDLDLLSFLNIEK